MENVALVSIPYGKGKAGGTNKYMCGLNLTYQFPMVKVKSIVEYDENGFLKTGINSLWER